MSNFNNRATSFASAAARTTTYDSALRDYMVKVYNFMAIALAISGAIAFLVANTPSLMVVIFGTPLMWVAMLAPLGFVIYMGAKLNSISAATAKTYLWIYSALMGISLASIFVVYTGTSIARVFFITASVFGAMGLIGLIVASIVNIFLKSSAFDFAISLIGVLLFIGLTAYDTQRIKQTYYHFSGNSEMVAKMAVVGALNLYMDFINLFLMLLRFFGDRR